MDPRLSLPCDVLIVVLQFVDDNKTFMAAVLSNRAWHRSFMDHPMIIPRCVLGNALGGDEVIFPALRTLRITGIMRHYSFYVPAHVANFIEDIKAFREDRLHPPTREEFQLCFGRARLCKQLEVFFSRARKDRLTRDSSRLSSEESTRFNAALHRIWCISAFTDPKSVVHMHCLAESTRVPLFFDEYTAQQMYDIICVVEWMEESVLESLMPDVSPPSDGCRLQCVFGGPGNLLKAYQNPNELYQHLPIIDRRFIPSDSWMQDLLRVFQKHKLLSPTETQLRIPPEIRWACKARPGVRLWNSDNWAYMPRKLRLETLLNWLDGLKHNYYERRLFLQRLGVADPTPKQTQDLERNRKYKKIAVALSPDPTLTVERIMSELCDLSHIVGKDEAKHLKNGKFGGITSKTLLCERCLCEMVASRLWLWWRQVKVAALPAEGAKPDCSLGFECELQKNVPDHAYKYNHACLKRLHSAGLRAEYAKLLKQDRKRGKKGRKKGGKHTSASASGEAGG
ncbi:hypothetical protein EXIGLDRAFT_760635 [Exidia glandulosa HHB12029]|uniref:Uncharacterized protein n=1 Tax=Exidia glandulosa HHB12029 TaxID=1314781 RepID=A0A165P731_EXIGL|nr:hypothetical protein EXIGLDRAFT_760635 [Exidia glandulosa HHB12029]